MSRVGKKAVAIPAGVTANVDGQTVNVKGPKGALQLVLHGDVGAKLEAGGVQIDPRNETKLARALWGTSRASVQGKNLQIALGYSHDIVHPIPDGITIVCPKPTEIVVTGIDKQKVGQVAANIRDYRPPEPYKGKGIKYAGEFIFRKQGKKK
jgi:large subunit ribosomal protein L6